MSWKPLLLVVLLFSSSAHAQDTIVGRWEVRHSTLGHAWIFDPSGRFEYSRFRENFGSLVQLGTATGKYQVINHNITLTQSDGSVFQTTFRLARNSVSLGRNALYIVMPDGREEMFFPD